MILKRNATQLHATESFRPSTIRYMRARSLVALDHPMGGDWVCGECEARIQTAAACQCCHTLLCPGCAQRNSHAIPAGKRVGEACGAVVTDESTAEVAA